jgi:hypothetical protein
MKDLKPAGHGKAQTHGKIVEPHAALLDLTSRVVQALHKLVEYVGSLPQQ